MEGQIAYILRQAEEGTAVGEVCRKGGISEATFYVWRKNNAGLIASGSWSMTCAAHGKSRSAAPAMCCEPIHRPTTTKVAAVTRPCSGSGFKKSHRRGCVTATVAFTSCCDARDGG